MASERDELLEQCKEMYATVHEGSPAMAVVFAVEMLAPILLDLRDAIRSVADRQSNG